MACSAPKPVLENPSVMPPVAAAGKPALVSVDVSDPERKIDTIAVTLGDKLATGDLYDADCLRFDLNGWQTLLVHDIADVPAVIDADIKLVITGHSHKPRIEWRGEQLYLNPGSAGRRRFKLPVTLVLLEVLETSIEPRLVSLLE